MTLHSTNKLMNYIDAASTFYGNETANAIYTFADNVCRNAFDNRISAELPIILTTAMTAYNRFSGQYVPGADTIEIVRHHCHPRDGLVAPIDLVSMLKTLAHELCHVYQYKILGGSTGSRGPHRCKSWYESIRKASPYVCGVDVSDILKPLKSIRVRDKIKKVRNELSLTESEITHWPNSIVELVDSKDQRIMPYIISASIFDE